MTDRFTYPEGRDPKDTYPEGRDPRAEETTDPRTTYGEDRPGMDSDRERRPEMEPDVERTSEARMTDAPAASTASAPTATSTTTGPLLADADAESFRARWTDAQTGFVDAPREAVKQADELVVDLMQHLAATFADERSRLEKQWDRGDEVSTDELRNAFQRYRSFFERLLAA
jgi:hypothetical protein